MKTKDQIIGGFRIHLDAAIKAGELSETDVEYVSQMLGSLAFEASELVTKENEELKAKLSDTERDYQLLADTHQHADKLVNDRGLELMEMRIQLAAKQSVNVQLNAKLLAEMETVAFERAQMVSYREAHGPLLVDKDRQIALMREAKEKAETERDTENLSSIRLGVRCAVQEESIRELTERAETAERNAAEMRDVIKRCTVIMYNYDAHQVLAEHCEKALSSNAGKSYVPSSELKEARELLEQVQSELCHPAISMIDADSRDWVQPKCDELFCKLKAFLAKTK